MTYEVLARKWRPQNFEDVVGQETVTHTLQNAIRSGRVAHAFLFSGVRGVGKTTTARILAKALNCEHGPTPSPCGECIPCREIAAGNSLDVLEIDAASHTGVENIRELRENIRYAAARDRFKIFIIDEAHMLSNSAFNALLKTLEEPPPHVKFILATTEHHKIPATITSRCQQFDFKCIPFASIRERLNLVAREEGIEISDYALGTIVSAAQGSMRDAQSALDQVIAFCGKQVQDEDVRTLLGVVDERLLSGIVDAILERQRKPLLDKVQEVQNYGIDAQNFCRRLIGYVRNLLVCKVSGGDDRLLQLPDSEKEILLRQAKDFSELDLVRFYDLLNRTENELRWNPHPYIHLEMALIKLIELARLPELEQVIGKIQTGQPPQVPAAGLKPPPTPKLAHTVEAEKKLPETSIIVSQLMQAVQMESIRLYSSLRHAADVQFENGKLLIVFPSAEKFHHSTVAQNESLDVLAKLCAKITGSSAHVEVKVEEANAAKLPVDPLEEDPMIKAFLDKFPGKVIKVEE